MLARFSILRDVMLIIVSIVTLAGFSTQALLGAPLDKTDGVVFLIAPPWGANVAEVVADLDGHLIGPEQPRFGVIAEFPDTVEAQVLKKSGIWGIRDGASIARICGAAL